MQMIRHEQAEPAMPRELLVIMLYRRQHSSADVRAAQLVLVPGHTIDGDEKPTAFSDPLRNCVRQLFADGQIHVRSVTESANLKHESCGCDAHGATRPTNRGITHGAHGVTRPTSADLLGRAP